MSSFATVTLKVIVELETDPGLMTPDSYEPPYDYLAIREVSHSAVEIHGEPGAALLVEQGGADDLDPDDLLIEGVRAALISESGSTLFSTD